MSGTLRQAEMHWKVGLDESHGDFFREIYINAHKNPFE